MPFSFASICPDDNSILDTNVPCEGITPASMSCSENVSIVNIANFSINQSINMSIKIPASDIYNFSFSYNVSGQYLITLCNNATATITVTNGSNITTPAPSYSTGGQTSWQAPGITGIGYNETNETNLTIEPIIISCGLSCKADNVVNNLGKYLSKTSPRIGFIIELLFCGGIIFLVYRVRKKNRKVNKLENPRNIEENIEER